MKKHLWLIFICLLSQHIPASTASNAADFKLVGQSELSVLFFKIFKSKLYTQSGKYNDSTKALKLNLQYQRDIAAKRLIEHTEDEWIHLGMNNPKKQQWLKQLTAMWPNIKKHDELTLIIRDDGSAEFYFNNKSIGTISDRDFGQQFAAIWLSPNTSKPKHRAKLLGIK